jgi:hypothetical protein
MYRFHNNLVDSNTFQPILDDTPDLVPDEIITTYTSTPAVTSEASFLNNFLHIVQFCYLCAKRKVTPTIYSIDSSASIKDWFSKLIRSTGLQMNDSTHHDNSIKQTRTILQLDSTDNNDTSDNNNPSSPDQTNFKKDQQFLYTMLRMIEKNRHQSIEISPRKRRKEPGFTRIETLHKNLIQNASATPPYDTKL